MNTNPKQRIVKTKVFSTTGGNAKNSGLHSYSGGSVKAGKKHAATLEKRQRNSY